MSEHKIPLKDLVEKYKLIYRSIHEVFCPYLNVKIKFTMSGFRHLIWKKDIGRRKYKDIIERFKSLIYINSILSKSGTLQEYEKRDLEYFGFIAIIENKKYKVIVGKDINNTHKFISIIPAWKTGKRDGLT